MNTYTSRYQYRTQAPKKNYKKVIQYITIGVIIIAISLIVNTDTYQALIVALS